MITFVVGQDRVVQARRDLQRHRLEVVLSPAPAGSVGGGVGLRF